MAEKKKQASIAAFFSPRAKSATPPPAPPTAPLAPTATAAAAAATATSPKKQQRKSPKSPKSAVDAAGGAKRPRATSSPKAASSPHPAAASDNTKEQPADLRSPAFPEAVAAAAADLSETPSKSDTSGKRTIVELFATPPPPKRAKKRDAAVDAEEKEADATETSQQSQPAGGADDSDGVLSGDEDFGGGPHAMGPHATAPMARKVVGKPRGRKAKASPKAAKADATAAAAAAAPSGAAAAKSRAKAAGAKATVEAPGATVTATPKAKEKRQPGRAAKEKAAADPAPVEQKPLPPPIVLDPLVKARVDTYQQKIDELTQQCTHLLQASGTTDGILQEIYGLAVDSGLDLEQEGEELGETVTGLFSDLSREQTSEGKSDAVTEFSADLKGFVAKSIQGHSDSLSSLSHKLLETLGGLTQSGEGSGSTVDAKVEARVLVMLEMEIKMLAQRTNYGVRPAKANLFEDTSADALWIWEIGNVEKYFGDESQKTIKRMRKNRKRLGLQLKALARVVHLLHQTPVDEVKVSAEEAKVSKFVLAVESEMQKAQDRERKELEKVQVAEQKKLSELEKGKAKQEEKRKREEDDEAERALANKRKKSLVSYFRSIDSTSGNGSGASGVGTGDGAPSGEQESGAMASMSQADRRKARRASAQNEIMARMDATVAFLVGGEKPSAIAASSAPAGDIKSAQQVRAHVQGERKSSARVTAVSGFWNSRRRRDPALGVMKLLQFHENYRPAYFGTFSTKSRVFRGGRRPLAQYTKFDYAVDSEEEWEEEEPGESLSDADSDMEESDDDLDYGDQWLAYEDEVDYMDGAEDEEAKEGEDGDGYLASPERKKKRVPEQKKRAKVPGRKKGAKPLKLEPQIVGPFLFEDASSVEAAVQLSVYAGELLRQPLFESALMRKAREYEEEKERQRVLLEQQQLELEQQKQQQQSQEKQAASSSAGEPAAASAAVPAAAAASTPKQPKSHQTKTPTKTPQKRKASVENLASPQQVTAAAAAAAGALPAAKSGITAWLKNPKPAVVDLSVNTPESDASTVVVTTTTTAVPAAAGSAADAVAGLVTHESDA